MVLLLQEGEAQSEVVKEVISSQVQQLLASQSLQEYSQSYISNHASTSLQHAAAAAEMLHVLHPQQDQEAVKLLLDSPSVSDEPGIDSATLTPWLTLLLLVLDPEHATRS